ncbi:MAG: ABC transporter permease, partial [Armatimonadetes bacterium]|nr:ABC transporter permease [Armatimonadota bacterium]
LHSLLVLRLRVDAILSGVSLNLLAMGLTTFLLRSLYSKGNIGVQVRGPDAWFPAVKSVPVLGTLLGGGTPFVPLALIAIFLVWFLVHRTRPGLQLRAVGEAPGAARAAGILLDRTRMGWVAAGGALAGLGGAYLCLEAAARFTENLSAGKGYLALAAVIIGRWQPLGAALAVLVFSLAEALQIRLQGGQVGLPSELLSALPYTLGLLALSGVLGRVRPPAGLGQLD